MNRRKINRWHYGGDDGGERHRAIQGCDIRILFIIVIFITSISSVAAQASNYVDSSRSVKNVSIGLNSTATNQISNLKPSRSNRPIKGQNNKTRRELMMQSDDSDLDLTGLDSLRAHELVTDDAHNLDYQSDIFPAPDAETTNITAQQASLASDEAPLSGRREDTLESAEHDEPRQSSQRAEMEKLVRSQIEATNWATVAPNEYLLSLSDAKQADLSMLHFYNDSDHGGPWPQHPAVDTNRAYPNHRYTTGQGDQDAQGGAGGGGASSRSPLEDPLTTLSDASRGVYSFAAGKAPSSDQNRAYPGHYLYRLRGPTSVATTRAPAPGQGRNPGRVSHQSLMSARLDQAVRANIDRGRAYEPQSSIRVDQYANARYNERKQHNQSTQAPNSVRAFARLNHWRNSKPPREADQEDATMDGVFSSSSSNPRTAALRRPPEDTAESSGAGGQLAGKISAQGFMDVAAGDEPADKHTEESEIAATTTLVPLAHAAPSNTNGSLAARLSANRYRNRPMPTTRTTTTGWRDRPHDTRDSDKVSPLTIDFPPPYHAPRSRQMDAFGPHTSTTRLMVQDTSATTARIATARIRTTRRPSSVQQSRAGPDHLPSATTGVPPGRTTTPQVNPLSPNQALVALYAAALKSGALVNATRPQAHHHHLHSHIHSIKPAFIQIPLAAVAQQRQRQQRLAAHHQTKYNAYEAMMAAAAATAAAAAAAAAASSASRNNRAGGALLPGSHQQAAAAASSLIRSALLASRPPEMPPPPLAGRSGHWSAAPASPLTIPIGGTLASIPRYAPTTAKPHSTGGYRQHPRQQAAGFLASLIRSALGGAGGGRVQFPSGGGGTRNNNHRANTLHLQPSNQVPSFYSDPTDQARGVGLPLSLSSFAPLFDSALESSLGAEMSPLLTTSGDHSQPTPLHLTNQPSDKLVGYLDEASEPPAVRYNMTADLLRGAYIDWASAGEGQNNSSAFSGLENMFDNVIFAPLGDDPNLLYPVALPAPLAGSSNPSSRALGNLSTASSQASLAQESLADANYPRSGGTRTRPNTTGQFGETGSKASSGSRRAVKKIAVKHRPDGQQLSRSRVKVPPPLTMHAHDHKARPAAAATDDPMPYALGHYVGEQLDGGDPQTLFGYLPAAATFAADQTAGGQAAASLQSFLSSPSLDADGFRPISGPAGPNQSAAPAAATYHQLPPRNQISLINFDDSAASSHLLRQQLSEAVVAGKSKSRPRPIKHHQLALAHLKHPQDDQSPPLAIFEPAQDFVQPPPQIGELFPSAAYSTERDKRAQNHQPRLQLMATPSHYLVSAPADQLLHQALLRASSSILRPHLVAASDYLLNQHDHQLHDHLHHRQLLTHTGGSGGGSNMLRYGPADLATSESARLSAAATTGLAGPATRAYLLHHYWPLALALLPVMIVVAIVAQLVMAAPLAMFALTTMSVTRFAGSVFGPAHHARGEEAGADQSPLWYNMDHEPSAVGSTSSRNSTRIERHLAERVIKLAGLPSASRHFVASIWPNGTASIRAGSSRGKEARKAA